MKRRTFAVLSVLFPLTGLPSPTAYAWVTEVVDQLPSGGAGGEYASLAVDTNGFVHICSQNESVGGLQYTSNVSGAWVSTILDGTTSGGYVGSHASITLDSSDRVHISYKGEAGLKYATNASGAWVISVVDVEPLGTTGYCTSIAVDSSDRVHISYIGQRGWELYLRYATNASGSWQKVTLDSPYPYGPFIVTNYTSIALDSTDKVHVSYCWNALKYATNASGTWVKETVDFVQMSQNSIEVDGSDKVHISYFDYTNRKLKVAENASGAWDTETVDSADYGGAAIVLDSGGNAHVSYRGETGGLRYATNASGSWVTEPVDALPIGYFNSIALDGQGAVRIAYHDSTNHALKYATHAPGLWVTTLLDSVGNLGRGTSIALDGSEWTHISYADDTNGTLKYATNASGAWGKETVDPGAAEDTAIALDDSGKAYISYIRAYGDHWDDADVKVATNVSGSWQNETVDSCPGASTRSTSIAVDHADRVHMSYTSSGLKYGTNTSGEWITETVDASGGADNSIGLDSLGNVHIGYRASAGLKVATNASGTWQTTELDPTAWKYCSLAVDNADRVHIAYVSYIDDNPCLRYATNVSGAWVTQTVHASTLGLEFFEDASIAVDSMGGVHICHREAVTSNLRHTTNASGDWLLSNMCNRVQGGGVDASIAVGPSGRIHVGHHGGDGTLLVTLGSGPDNPSWRPATTLASESRVASATTNHILSLAVPVGILLLLRTLGGAKKALARILHDEE